MHTDPHPRPSFAAKLKHELQAVAVATLFFGLWLGVLVLLKTLVLAEYQIGFAGWSRVVGGALILGKVALLLEHVSLGAWEHRWSAWASVLVRTALYSLGVLLVLLLEHGIRERHEHGGVVAAAVAGFRDTSDLHILLNTLVVSGALLAYNAVSVIRRHLGPFALLRMFRMPLPREGQTRGPAELAD